MINTIHYVILSFSILAFCNTNAQNRTFLDSLKTELNKAINAQDKTGLLSRITWNTPNDDVDSIKKYGSLALKTALQTGNDTILAHAYDAAAKWYRLTNNFDMAKKLYFTSTRLATNNGLYNRAGWGYYHLASIAVSENNIDTLKKNARLSYTYFKKAGHLQNALNGYWMLVLKTNQFHYADTILNIMLSKEYEINDETSKLFYYINLSQLYNILENRKKAMEYVQLAAELADKLEHSKGTIKAYYQIADYFKNYQNNYEVALKYYQKILEIQMKRATIYGGIYTNIGEMHRLMGNDRIAFNNFKKALEIGMKKNHRHTKADAFMKIGELNYQQKNYDKALYNFLKCYETGCDICPDIRFHDVLVKIGTVYSLSNDTQNALNYYNKSIDLADSSNDNRARSHSYLALADFYEKQNIQNKAEVLYQKAFNIAMRADYLHGQKEIASKLSSFYKSKKKFFKAFEFLEISNVLKDSIQKISETSNMAQLENYFDFQQLQLQNKLNKIQSEKEIVRQKNIRNYFILSFILVSILGYVIYTNYRRKKRDNKILLAQKAEIEKMAKKVHEADQAKLQFFTNISHELKTPLTIILGITEKLHSKVEQTILQTIRRNLFRLIKLISNLLDLRKLDTDNISLNISENNIVEFIEGLTSNFKDLAYQKNQTLNFYSKNKEIRGYFDIDKLEKIITNLISNAIKYTPEKGQINVAIKVIEEEFVEFTVKDNGIGIPEKEIKSIFDRFYRISEHRNQGSGVGLALTKELVELHQGNISVKSKTNEGAEFKVKIPIGKEYYSINELIETADRKEKTESIEMLDFNLKETKEISNEIPNEDKETILIVEDNNDLRRYISDIFCNRYNTLKAIDGEEGYKIAMKHVPDIIISDIMMPKLSGIQLVELLKNNTTTSHIPIILLTAKDDIGTRLNGFEKGADDYISKPFDSHILLSRVENLLRLRKLLVEKFSKQFKLQPREITIENADQKFLQLVIDTIENHISNPELDIDLLTIEIGTSRTQLYRKLKALTDYSANQFIRIIRMKRAAQILKQGQNNIAEVMDAIGFSNYSHFNNCFKEYFGEYPKDYALLSIKGSVN